MFSEIEHQYQAALSERRFWNYYRIYGSIVVVFGIIAVIIFGLDVWMVSGATFCLLFILVGLFFHQDMKKIIDKSTNIKDWRSRLDAYAQCDRELRIGRLLDTLKSHGLDNQDDLKLAVDYYSRSRPVTTKTSVLEWVLSVTITLASVVAFAYDDQRGAVDENKLLNVILPTIWLVIIIVVPALLIGFIFGRIFFSRSKIENILVEDLAYIYVNFDKYRQQLQK